MKKHFLFVAITIAALTSLFAQKVEQRPASQAAAAALMEANNPKVARISPHENAPIYSTNNVNGVLIGKASNAYGYLKGEQRQLSTVNSIGTNGGSVAFIFRQRWEDCGSAANETGILRYNLSTNGGQSWFGFNGNCLGQGPLNPAFTYGARYPNALLFSDGGTSTNNLNLAYCAPTISGTTWLGAVYGCANDVINPVQPTINQEEYTNTGTTGIYRPINIVERVSGEFWSATLSEQDSLFIRKGIWNSATQSILWNISQIIVIGNAAYLESPAISFSPDGQKGYLVMTGDIMGGIDSSANAIICDYNATTGLFTAPYEKSLNDFAGIPAYVSQMAAANGVVANKASIINPTITVDYKGNLHIHALALPAGGDAGHIYTTFASDLYDMTKDTLGNWGAIHTASLSLPKHDIGSGTNMLTYYTHANVTRSPDGKYMIYSWADTDTTGMNGNLTIAPNLKGRIYSVMTDQISSIIDWTTNDPIWSDSVEMPKAAEVAFESSTCMYRVPISVSKQTAATGTEFYYFSNVEYTCSQATNTPQWMKNCNISPITISPTLTSPSCGGTTSDGAIQINATGGTLPYIYMLNNPDGSNISTSSSPIFSNLPAYIYKISVKDAGGCQVSSQFISLDQVGAPAISINGPTTLCAGNQVCLNVVPASPNCSYIWNIGTNGPTLCINIPYNYGVQSNCGGCYSYAAINVNIPDTIAINTVTTNVSCAGGANGTITTNVTGGIPPYNYQWSGNITTANLTNLAAGTYNLTVTDANGCQMNAAPVTITAPTAISAQINGIGNTFSASISGGIAPYTYSWTGPVCFTPPTSSTSVISVNCPTCSGVYHCFVTDVNGCTTTANTTCILAIDDKTGLTSFSLVPNPAFEVTTINLAFERSENVSISIVNVHGQSIFEKKMGNVLNVMEDIKVKDWAKGVYYVKISTDNGIISRKLVID